MLQSALLLRHRFFFQDSLDNWTRELSSSPSDEWFISRHWQGRVAPISPTGQSHFLNSLFSEIGKTSSPANVNRTRPQIHPRHNIQHVPDRHFWRDSPWKFFTFRFGDRTFQSVLLPSKADASSFVICDALWYMRLLLTPVALLRFLFLFAYQLHIMHIWYYPPTRHVTVLQLTAFICSKGFCSVCDINNKRNTSIGLNVM